LLAAVFFFNDTIIAAITSRCLVYDDHAEILPLIRGYGSLAWALAGPVFGWFQGTFGIATMFQTVFVSINAILIGLILDLPVAKAYAQSTLKEINNKDVVAQSYNERVINAIWRPNVFSFLVQVLLAGIHNGTFFVLGFVFVEQELGAKGVEIGLYVFTTAILELPFFLVAHRIAKGLGGTMRTLYFLNWIGAVRFGIGYYMSASIWQLLCFEWLHALMFALYFTQISEFAEAFHQDGLQATVFSLTGFMFASGMMLASVASGIIADLFDMRTSFLCMGLLFAAVGLLTLRTPRKSGPTSSLV